MEILLPLAVTFFATVLIGTTYAFARRKRSYRQAFFDHANISMLAFLSGYLFTSLAALQFLSIAPLPAYLVILCIRYFYTDEKVQRL